MRSRLARWNANGAFRPALFGLLILLPGGTPVAQADGPALEFDLTPIVECTDVTPVDFAEAHPTERIIEAVFRISLRLKQGSTSDVREITFEVNSPHQRLLVFDYSPDMVLESPVEGPIEVTHTKEKGSTIGAGLSGGTGVPFGGVNLQISPSATIGTSKRNLEIEKEHRIADKKVVLIAGTMHNGYGVFFKLRPSGQTALEGRKEFCCRYIVPSDWRGDWVSLSCRAVGEHTQYFMKSIKPSGETKLNVGLYIAGDEQAHLAARRLAAAQGLAPRRGTELRAQQTATKKSGVAAAGLPGSESQVETSAPPEKPTVKTAEQKPAPHRQDWTARSSSYRYNPVSATGRSQPSKGEDAEKPTLTDE